MKNLFLATLTFIALSSYSQKTLKEFFSSDDVTWFGLNFTDARMIGAFDQINGAGDATPASIKNKWIPSWNGLVIGEPKNFKIKEAFRKTNLSFEMDANSKLNDAINTEKLMTFNAYSLADPQKTIKNVVSKLNGTEKKEGFGVTFVVESFNKMIDEAVIYVVIFDIKTKNVLLTEKVIGKPVGIGLRNFWAGAVKSVLKQIDKGLYDSWKSKNG